jgi:hypothetical protein
MIPQAEYLQRAHILRSAMEARNLNALLCYGSKRGQVRYISGYHPNYIANAAMVVLPKQCDAIMRIRFPFDLERARESSWIPDIAASGNTLNLASDAAAYLVEHQLAHGTIGLVTGDIVVDEMPRGLFQSLADMLPDVTWSEAGDVLQGIRVGCAAELSSAGRPRGRGGAGGGSPRRDRVRSRGMRRGSDETRRRRKVSRGDLVKGGARVNRPA